jgi:hypothetical protein
VVNLVGRHGNAGAGEVAAVAMGFCLVAWKLDNSPRGFQRLIVRHSTAKFSGAVAYKTG